eukprot:scaffold86951_cov48-Cyclotella_meneghiniana.AAC.4
MSTGPTKHCGFVSCQASADVYTSLSSLLGGKPPNKYEVTGETHSILLSKLHFLPMTKNLRLDDYVVLARNWATTMSNSSSHHRLMVDNGQTILIVAG